MPVPGGCGAVRLSVYAARVRSAAGVTRARGHEEQGGRMSIDTIRHWQIGDVQVTRIVEVDAWEDDITMLVVRREAARAG